VQRLRRRRVNGGAQLLAERQRHRSRHNDAGATGVVVNVCAVVIAVAGLAIVSRAEVVDHTPVGMFMVVVMVMMRVRRVAMIVGVNNGIGKASRRCGKRNAESRSNGKY
jgi:hypothetical protein